MGITIDRFIKLGKHLTFVRKPRVLARVARGYFRTAVLKRQTLRSVELMVTPACQAKCDKCYAADLMTAADRNLSVDNIRDIMSQAAALGAIHVNITGGEPTLRKDLPEVIRACQPHRVVVSVVTNALSLDRDKMRTYKKAGLNTIQISLDSADPQTHDEARGVPGCYHAVMATASLAREFGINLVLTTVLAADSRTDERAMEELLDVAEREDAFLLLCDSASIGGWKDRPDMVMTCEKRDQRLSRLLRHPRSRHHNMYNFRMKQGCPAGLEKIYITVEGEITPCNLIHDSAGNVLTEPLEVIWKRMCNHSMYAAKHTSCLRYLPGFEDRARFSKLVSLNTCTT